MSAMASQITSLTIVYLSLYPGADQRKHQSSASLPFVGGIHRWPVNSPHQGPVTRKIFPFDDVIMKEEETVVLWCLTIFMCGCGKQVIKQYAIMTSSNGSFSRVTVPLSKKSTGHRWNSLTKRSNADIWCFFVVSVTRVMNWRSIDRWFETSWPSLNVMFMQT